jgi:putative transposase
MRQAFLYRLYVNETQSDKLDNLLRLARQLYNAALQQRRDAWKYQQRSLNYYDQANQLKELRNEIPEFAQLNFSATQDMLRRLDKSFKAFFRRVKTGDKAGFPRFKGRDRFDSITFPAYGDGIKVKGNHLYVQNVGLLKIKMHRTLVGEINTATIKRECGKWYVVFSNTVEIEPLPVSDKIVGIDVGLNSFAVTSDGEFIANPRYLREAQRKLRVMQRSVSRKKKGSHNRRKAVRILAKKHLKVKRQRADFAHKVADNLVKVYGGIAVEDLKIKNMQRNHHLALSISDAGWGQFLSILAYKAEYAGRRFIQVNPDGTSQRCSRCGATVPKTLSVRIHHCPCCGLTIDRDLNSALEIKRLGLSLWDSTCASGQCVSQKLSALADRVVTYTKALDQLN